MRGGGGGHGPSGGELGSGTDRGKGGGPGHGMQVDSELAEDTKELFYLDELHCGILAE